jgi:hypothetical protein
LLFSWLEFFPKAVEHGKDVFFNVSTGNPGGPIGRRAAVHEHQGVFSAWQEGLVLTDGFAKTSFYAVSDRCFPNCPGNRKTDS